MTSTPTISGRTGTFLTWGTLLKAMAAGFAGSLLVQRVSMVEGVDIGAIYSGVFDLLTVFTGFLSTLYVFVAARQNKFLEEIRNTRTYRIFLRLVKFTILWSAMIVLLSYAMMIGGIQAFPLWTATHALVGFWTLNLALIVINFSRCVAMFIQIAEVGKS